MSATEGDQTELSGWRTPRIIRRFFGRSSDSPLGEWELAGDVVELGIVLAGGGALLVGLDERLREETGLSVQVAESPLTCVAIGAGHSLQELAVIGKSARAQARRRRRFLR